MLAGFFALTVVEVALPDEVFVLELAASDGEALGRYPIEGVMSLHVEPTPRLTEGAVRGTLEQVTEWTGWADRVLVL